MESLAQPGAGTPLQELSRVMQRWRFWFLFWNSLYYVMGLLIAVLAAAATQDKLFSSEQTIAFAGIAALLSSANLALSPKDKAERFRTGFVGLKSALDLQAQPNLDRARRVFNAVTGATDLDNLSGRTAIDEATVSAVPPEPSKPPTPPKPTPTPPRTPSPNGGSKAAPKPDHADELTIPVTSKPVSQPKQRAKPKPKPQGRSSAPRKQQPSPSQGGGGRKAKIGQPRPPST